MPRKKSAKAEPKAQKHTVRPVSPTPSAEEKANRAQCATPGCRKKALPGDTHCRTCANDAIERSVRVTEMEALQFGRMDAEMRNHIQGMELVRMKANESRTMFQAQMRGFEEQQKSIAGEISVLQPQYDKLVRELAAKYGVKDHTKMTIDPDTRILRDLTKEAT